jgi:hypothetical protein
MFIGFPVLWVVFFALLFAVHGWPFAGMLQGLWAYAYPADAFIVSSTAFFVWLLTSR